MSESFTCPACGLTSFHASDAGWPYCARCKRFIRDWALTLVLSMSDEAMEAVESLKLVYARSLADGRFVAVQQLLGGRPFLTLRADQESIQAIDYWQYEDAASAVVAAATWRPDLFREPFGWCGHLGSGRRRPGGNPAVEHLRR